jgi:hypothetical protein
MLRFVLIIFSRIDLYSNGSKVPEAVVEFLFLNDGYVPKGAFKHLWETPCADPHVGCCGGWGLETLGYPIRFIDE